MIFSRRLINTIRYFRDFRLYTDYTRQICDAPLMPCMPPYPTPAVVTPSPSHPLTTPPSHTLSLSILLSMVTLPSPARPRDPYQITPFRTRPCRDRSDVKMSETLYRTETRHVAEEGANFLNFWRQRQNRTFTRQPVEFIMVE